MQSDSAAATTAFNQADSVLAQASTLDPKWPEPLIMRGGISSRMVRLTNRDQMTAKPIIDRGLGFVEQALVLAPQDADALFQRGELRYWRYLLGLEPDPVASKKLLLDAQNDLETSVKINPSEAQAWASLAHLYYHTKGETDVKIAARRAYEADAYLSNIDVVIERLYLASYDLAQFSDAQHWCKEGETRFPRNYGFDSAGSTSLRPGHRTRCSSRLAPRGQRRGTHARRPRQFQKPRQTGSRPSSRARSWRTVPAGGGAVTRYRQHRPDRRPHVRRGVCLHAAGGHKPRQGAQDFLGGKPRPAEGHGDSPAGNSTPWSAIPSGERWLGPPDSRVDTTLLADCSGIPPRHPDPSRSCRRSLNVIQ